MAKKKAGEKEIIINGFLKGIKVPILTLDERWYEVFPDHEKTAEIKNLESHLNELIREQGKLVNDIKEMKGHKKRLMRNIVANIDNSNKDTAKSKIRQQEMDQKNILEMNDKLNEAEDRLIDLPYAIKETNQELLVAGMKVLYARLKGNRQEIGEIAEWIVAVREELKRRILLKQDMEIKNDAIYTYMHDLVGAEVMEFFDKNNQ